MKARNVGIGRGEKKSLSSVTRDHELRLGREEERAKVMAGMSKTKINAPTTLFCPHFNQV